MPVFIMILVALAALAVLVGVVYVVLGKGGRLARVEADYPPLDLPEDGAIRPPDLNRLVLPLAMWGYHVRAVDELLVRLAATLRAREERIQDLEWRLSRLDPSYVPEGTGPGRTTRLPGDAYAPERGTGSEPGNWSEQASPTWPGAAAEPRSEGRAEGPAGADSVFESRAEGFSDGPARGDSVFEPRSGGRAYGPPRSDSAAGSRSGGISDGPARADSPPEPGGTPRPDDASPPEAASEPEPREAAGDRREQG
ncbi:hypothetical protein [Nocardiopsis sp. NRRL B-16309]|uniref:hypothetical protein n=1 Tax=Nocardiopsis sp. NRRL B-16309 TaxID=1519494 RepID=UPI00350F9B39